MKFETFDKIHIKDAAMLAIAQYERERKAVSILPSADYYNVFCEMLSKIAQSNLGIAAYADDTLIGFISGYGPLDNYFGTSSGIFIPIHGHGSIYENRKYIYSRLYQEASKRWITEGLLSHAIALYSHDVEVIDSFFFNGFGSRCIDAISAVKKIECKNEFDIKLCEATENNYKDIAHMKNHLIRHLRSAPMFMSHNPNTTSYDISKQKEQNKARYFIAKDKEKTIGYIKISEFGENFACDAKDMANISGAYLMHEYRGKGIYTSLLSYLMQTLSNEGYVRCGVDYESFNYTANAFWKKYFTPYTYSLTRRVDERIC